MLDSYFKISERGSSIAQEVRGGLVTFFTMAYIVALNPIILAYSPDANGQFLFGGAAPAPAMVAATTALVAGVLTILMGSIANYPLALATGLGLNTFVAVGIASKMTWAAAMGLVVLEGLIILVLVLTGFRVAVFNDFINRNHIQSPLFCVGFKVWNTSHTTVIIHNLTDDCNWFCFSHHSELDRCFCMTLTFL